MFNIIEFKTEECYINDFISVSEQLYTDRYPIAASDTRKMLERAHPLSKYYEMDNFIVYNGETPVARCSLFFYPDDPVAYLGLYECIDDLSCSQALFDYVRKYVVKRGYQQIIGPVDSSFYVKYRLKISGFDQLSYFAEPYNQEYYYQQFLAGGFVVKYKYSTKIIDDLHSDTVRSVVDRRYNICMKKGYEFKSLKDVKFEKAIKDLYELFLITFDVLPLFKHIEYQDFTQLFKYFRYIARPDQVQLVYYKDELVAFALILPNYNHLFNRPISFKTLLEIIKVRFFNKDYVGLYFGAKPGHYITSKATIKKAYDSSNPDSVAIAALMKSDAGSTNHYKENYKLHSEYVLMSLDLAS